MKKNEAKLSTKTHHQSLLKKQLLHIKIFTQQTYQEIFIIYVSLSCTLE